jgi:hypothetical protein
MGEMFICEKCREMVDPNSADVIRLIRWDEVEAAFNAPATRLEGPGAYFHRKHAPSIGLKWRRPTDPNG